MEKYHSFHEEDISSFDLPSTRGCIFNKSQRYRLTKTDRLPTVSAAEALEDLVGGVARHISTGIGRLDETLLFSSSRQDCGSARGGLQRGQVSEIWGPPGSGKTALGIQLVANALCDGHGAIWLPKLTSLGCTVMPSDGRDSANEDGSGHYRFVVSSSELRLPQGVRWSERTAAGQRSGIISEAAASPTVHHQRTAETSGNARLRSGDVVATGVVGVHYDTSQPSVLMSNAPRAKRKLVEAGLEVPDSEEEDNDEYGWVQEDDAALPGPPPQWQGSEDILLGTQAAESEEDGDGDRDCGDNDGTDDEAEVEGMAVSGRDSDELAE
ncbi:hypothetical protein CSUB01_08640 [Colletotrichum sublineola]|uniref:RecA family profile 1 domain-containing protein n=1 Tax=Colletotrichum sublineola TaxID=1173701 RepID=A0A066XAY6_COLSU|nr:hypothetical protein CSUB01_08640 [Colletotrichum sublineola]